MKNFRILCALAPLCLAAACASGPFASTAYPSADRPDTARVYGDYMVARVAALTNDPEMAARRYASSIGGAPESADVAERAVFSALLAGDYGLASGLARRASDAGSVAALVQLTLAADALKRGKTKAAIQIVQGSDLGVLNRMVARNLEAWSFLGVDDAEAAEALLKQNLTGQPRLDNATMHMLGLLQVAAGDDAGAAATFETIWNSGARLAVGAEAYAELLAARGERVEANAILEQFRKDVGYNAELEALKARIGSGEAITPKRLTARQGAALSFYLPASALMTQTNDDVSAVYFVLAVALDPQLQPARLSWAQALVQGSRPEEALRVLADVPPESVFYPAARGQMARTLLREDRAQEALAVAAETLAAAPDRGLKLQLAEIYRALSRDAEAEAVFNDIIALDAAEARQDWRVHFLRGAARERQKNWGGAEQDLQHALSLQPENATVLNYLGYSWIDRGINLKDGFALIRRAVELEPKSGHIVDSLGWAHYRLGDYDEAVDLLERAVTLLPGDSVLNDHLGDAYWKAGRHKEAGFQWRRALKLDPAPDDRVLIEQKLLGGVAVDPPAPGASVAP